MPPHLPPGAAGAVRAAAAEPASGLDQAAPGAPVWRVDGDTVVLDRDGLPLARYTAGHGVPAVHAPRPHLHPVHTLAGALMTEASPVDHRHHYGFSVAIPEVNGTSFWGGRTFVRDVGPTLLPNHGQQVSAPVTLSSAVTGTLDDAVTWLDQHGDPLLSERRSIRGAVLPGSDGWSLRWTSDLVADHGDLTITSPGATGRPGAGYGGLFWRSSPSDETVVLSHGGEGESTAHGSRSPWVALAQRRGDSWTTLLLVQPGGPSPWFVRAATFPGAGPALAWDAPLTVEAGQTLRLDLTAVLLDRRLDLRAAGALAEEHSCVQ
ncbi:hypothetical protein Sked_05190 [Sanguibacter keddieii DSM 10542]|uniref:Methane oxygenase PmoA n=1 Tax=Sanguibacter keddieii (strain ATCC 51767 / DSM 10542 / NCFB 3025 / ST-74) TaxID=446469 RepID=D1BAC9_SANKS|nr:PmoA family protein [Sanguibacter keddieii]ACZ20480.1 hypothetical protein Sked_05190 [Sanguibacter keddieii DSM 10542]